MSCADLSAIWKAQNTPLHPLNEDLNHFITTDRQCPKADKHNGVADQIKSNQDIKRAAFKAQGQYCIVSQI